MVKSLIAATAILASAQLTYAQLKTAEGSAIVVNKCTYPVFLQNTPAAGGGASIFSQMLPANGGSYQQQFTQLDNGDGWSLKLSRDSSLSNILQYEYTWHDGDESTATGNDASVIWFDLSAVNGNPWDGNFEISATPGCNPRQAAYRFSTDDAYGMQDCPSDSEITVTLCSGEAGASSGSAPAPGTTVSSTEAAPTVVVSSPSEAPPASTNLGTPLGTVGGKVGGVLGGVVDGVQAGKVAADPKPSLTTFATMASAVLEPGSVTVVEVDTVFTTAVVMATEAPKNRERHAHHPHRHHS